MSLGSPLLAGSSRSADRKPLLSEPAGNLLVEAISELLLSASPRRARALDYL